MKIRKIISVMLITMMLFNLIPNFLFNEIGKTHMAGINAFAEESHSENPEQNPKFIPLENDDSKGRTRTAVIDSLAEEYGSEEAEKIFDSMLDMGIIDENGNQIIHKIVMDDKEYTLEQIMQIIDSPDVDLSKKVMIDGDEITLSTISNMVAYEEFLDYLDENFINNNIELTNEHLKNIEDIENQFKATGLDFKALSVTSYENGYRHDVYVKTTVTSSGQVNFDLYDGSGKLTKALPYDVRFDYKTLDGSANADECYTSKNGTITFSKNVVPTTKSITINISDKDNSKKYWRFNGKKSFFVYLNNPINIAFGTNKKRASLSTISLANDYSFPDFTTQNLYSKGYQGEQLSGTSDYIGLGSTNEAYRYAAIDGRVSKYTFSVSLFRRDKGTIYVKPGININGYNSYYGTGSKFSVTTHFGAGDYHKCYFNPPIVVDINDQQYNSLKSGKSAKIILTRTDGQFEMGNYGWTVYAANLKNSGYADGDKVYCYASDNRAPSVESISAPSGTFITGSQIPITVTFSEPIKVTSSVKLGIKNGSNTSTLSPISSEVGGKSSHVTYLYTVPQNPALKMYYTSVSGAVDLVNKSQVSHSGKNIQLASSLEFDNANSITSIAILPTEALPNQNVDITVNLYQGAGSTDQNAWLTGNTTQVNGNIYSTNKLYASIDGGKTKIPLVYTGDDETKITGCFNSPINDSGIIKKYQVELYMDISTSDTPVFLPIMDMKADLDAKPVVLVDENDITFNYPITPSGQDKTLFLGETITLGYNYSGDATFQTSDDFIWSSSDEDIATIDTETGLITPVDVGNVSFTITNLNRGFGTTTKITDTYIIKAGGTPKIETGTVISGVDETAQIRWSSNITYKNQNDVIPAIDTYYNIELYNGNYTIDDLPAVADTSYTSDKNANSFEIPKGVLSIPSADSITPSYTVRISTIFAGKEYSAIGHIIVSMSPAIVTITRPEKYSMLDTNGGITVTWETSSVDKVNGYSFMAEVAKNGVSISSSNDINGSIDIDFGDITGKLKDIYTVTAQIKNNNSDTWSYDSYILNVYDEQSMKIFVEDQNKTVIEMSNRDYIKNLSSAEIVALNREIFLRNTVGINHEQYDYGPISDQIEWSSEDNLIASINYQRGGEYRNIEEYSQTSYMPNTDFILAGHNDGNTIINATHKTSRMQRDLGVTVKTLKDRLYLFQVMPKAETTLVYTNGSNEIKTVKSDSNGAIAIYEEDGIKSDIKLSSKVSEQVYLGTIYNYNLSSGEQNGARSELYPINNFKLRKAAVVKFNFKKQNGSPYTGSITLNGGVYKNDKYCETAGVSEIITPNSVGFKSLSFDITKFWSEEAGETQDNQVEANDKLQYIFELTFGEDYEPMLVKISGNLSDNEIVESGESIVTLRPTTDETKNKPVIFSQTLNRFKSSGLVDELLNETGNIGLTAQTPKADIDTIVMWWGKPVTDTNSYVKLYDEKKGNEISGQAYKTFKYPFGTMLVTESKLSLSEDNIWVEEREKGKISTKLYDNNGIMVKSINMSYTVRNLLNVRNITTEPEVASGFQAKLKTFMSSTSLAGDSSDDFVGIGLEFINGLNFGVDNCALIIAPTKDPTIFNGILRVYAGEDVMSGPTSEGFSLSVAKDEDSKKLKNIQSKSGPKTFETDQLLKGKKGGEVNYQIGGYFAVRIMYNFDSQKWEIAPIGGGIRAGVGALYNWKKNSSVGPVPVTAELEVGAAVRVDFDTHILYEPLLIDDEYYSWTDEEQKYVNDYLTNLRVNAYIYAFGGVGFDFSVVALKIGVFGQVDFASNNKFLNRPYLEDDSKRSLKGQSITIAGQAGIKFVAKYLFISYQKVLASIGFSQTWTFNNWDKIEKYWKETTGDMVTPMSIGLAAQMYAKSIGADMMEISSKPKIESRSYLTDYGRVWGSKSSVAQFTQQLLSFKKLSIDVDNLAPEILQTNAYPYSNPIISDDGDMFVYLSDRGSESVWDTKASFAKKGLSGKYEDEGVIDSTIGFGDSQLAFDGDKDFAAAAWVCQYEKIEKDAGDEIDNSDIAIMTNGTEIVAGIYDGVNWETTKLTDNNTPDLAPVVAENGTNVIAAWRSVYSTDASAPTEFKGKDNILYKIYDGANWSEVKTIYNGISGGVMGICAEMLPDGTALISYIIDTSNEKDLTKYETVYAAVDSSGEIIKNVRLTNDDYMDENPQITTVNFGNDEDPDMRFVLGWHRHDERGSDIRLATINNDGELMPDFTDSIKTVMANGENQVTSNFKFAKGAKGVSDLSIMWTERNDEDDSDIIKAMKFIKDDELIYTSAVIDLAKMPARTLVDHYDAYISNPINFEVKSIILGTEYKTENDIIIEEDGSQIPVPKSECKMFTATERYKNKAEITNVYYDNTEIISGFILPINFTVENKGFEIINKVDINCDGLKTFEGINLYPGESKNFIVNYTVPENIVDLTYSGQAVFESTTVDMEGDKITLTVPDLGIGKISTVLEEDGQREFSIPLYNTSDYKLKDSGKSVVLSIYTDTSYSSSKRVTSVTISDNDKLEMIDNGAYIEMITFDIKSYLNGEEIPENGVNLFVKAVVKKSGIEVSEFVDSNNIAEILCENLQKRNNGEQFKIDVEQSNDTATTAILSLQNLTMAETKNGNVAINLTDKAGNIIETKYLSNTAEGLINLSSEEKVKRTFSFQSLGADVESYYFKADADDMNNDLQTLDIRGTGIEFDKDTLNYTLEIDSDSTNITANSANPNAIVKVLDNDGKTLIENLGGVAYTLPLDEGDNEISVVVIPNGEGAIIKTYSINVNRIIAKSGKVLLSGNGWFNHKVEVIISSQNLIGFTPIGFEYQIDNGEWITNNIYDGESASVITFEEEGIYTVNARLYDADGYKMNADSIVVKIDKVKPILSTDTLDVTRSSSNIVTLFANDDFSGIDSVVAIDADGNEYIMELDKNNNYCGEVPFFTGTLTVKVTDKATNYDTIETHVYKEGPVTFTLENILKQYNGNYQFATIIPSAIRIREGIDYKVTYKQNGKEVNPLEVGEYDVEIEVLNEDYEGGQTGKFTIYEANQLPLAINGVPRNVYYGDTFSVTTIGGKEGGTVKYEITSGSGIANIDEDTGTVTITGTGLVVITATKTSSNFTNQMATATFNVFPRELTVSATAKDAVYDGTTNVTISEFMLYGILNHDQVSVAEDYTSQMMTANVGDGKTVKINNISLTGDEASNYVLSSNNIETTVNISPIIIDDLTVKARDKIYDTTKIATIESVTSSKILEVDKESVIIDGTAQFNSANVIDADTVIFTPTILSGTKAMNYVLASDVTSSVSANILKANVEFGSSNDTYIYDNNEHKSVISATIESNGLPFTDYIVTYEGRTTGEITPKDVDVYDVIVTITNDNYKGSLPTTTLTISPANQTLLTINGIPNYQIEYKDTFNITAIGGSGTGHVTYEVVDGEATIDEITGRVDITSVGAVTIQAKKAGDGNYKEQTSQFTIITNKKKLNLTALTTNVQYNGYSQDITVLSDDEDFVIDKTIDDRLLLDENSITADYVEIDDQTNKNPRNVGKYKAIVKVAEDNPYYTSDATTGTLNVLKAPITITADDKERLYSEANPEFTLSYTLLGTDITSDIILPSISCEADEKSAVGEYVIKLTGEDVSQNYEATLVNGILKVNKNMLTITADDKNKYYSKPNPQGSVTYTGFVNGEDESVLNGELIFEFENIKDGVLVEEEGKTYDIKVSGPTCSNYNISFEKGILTVDALPVTVTPGTSRTSYFKFSLNEAVEGLQLGDISVSLNGIPVNITSVTPQTNNKAYLVKGEFEVGTKYDVVILKSNYEFNTIEITPKKPKSSGGGGSIVVPITYYIANYTAAEGGKITGKVSQKIESESTTSKVTAVADDGYKFVRWSDGVVTASRIDKLADNLTVTAEFEKTQPVINFSDVKGHWAEDNIDFVVRHGLFSGTSETEFSPDKSMTRGMVVTVLGRLAKADKSETNLSFQDVDTDAYYAPFVAWASENGIVNGVSKNKFEPERIITREEIATMIGRFIIFADYCLDLQNDSTNFEDESSIEDWAKDAVEFIKKIGIINGNENNEYKPKNTATRAEVATIMTRLIKLVTPY